MHLSGTLLIQAVLASGCMVGAADFVVANISKILATPGRVSATIHS